MAETTITTAPRIYYMHHRLVGSLGRFPEHFDRVKALGFDHVLVSPIYAPGRSGDVFFPSDHDTAHPGLETEYGAYDVIRWLVESAGERGLKLMLDVAPQSFALERRFVEAAPYTHFDIYGWQPAPAPARPKGGVGQGARALLAALPRVLGA